LSGGDAGGDECGSDSSGSGAVLAAAAEEEEAEKREIGVWAYRRWGGRRLVGVEMWWRRRGSRWRLEEIPRMVILQWEKSESETEIEIDVAGTRLRGRAEMGKAGLSWMLEGQRASTYGEKG
jgi:hypothetical protein